MIQITICVIIGTILGQIIARIILGKIDKGE